MGDLVGTRRRGTRSQGRALESLGHAVEYLVDQRLFARDDRERNNDQDAIQVLMQLSRAVFLECPEVVPVRRRLTRWLVQRSPAGNPRSHAAE